MENIILDIETDGLLDSVTKVHCIVMKVETKLYDTHAYYVQVATTESEKKEAIEKLRVNHIIGHNVLGFDLEVLNRLYGLEVPVDQVTDTLILSRLIYPDIRQEDAVIKRLEPRLWGSHSLKAWGYRLEHFKGEFGNEEEDFQELSQEMIDYCTNDVELTNILWKNLRAKLPPEKSVRLEHNIANICYQQEKNGFAFNEEQAIKLYSRLSKRRDELSEQLKEVFGSWLINEGLRRNELYSKIKIVDFNPNSRKHIAKRLKELRGWQPKEFTPSGEAKVDEAILKKLEYPEAKLMSEYLMINKRIGQLAEGDQAWLKLVKQGDYMEESTRWEHRLQGHLTQTRTSLRFQIQMHPMGRIAGLYLCRIEDRNYWGLMCLGLSCGAYRTILLGMTMVFMGRNCWRKIYILLIRKPQVCLQGIRRRLSYMVFCMVQEIKRSVRSWGKVEEKEDF